MLAHAKLERASKEKQVLQSINIQKAECQEGMWTKFEYLACSIRVYTFFVVELVHKNVENSDAENGIKSNKEADNDRKSWSRTEILQLIDLFKSNENLFKNTTIRKEKFWKEIAKKLNTDKTSEQCRNKFKSLKSMYLKKKDNMSSKQTGTQRIHFTYFEEMDLIFKKDHIVTPLAVVSSSRKIESAEEDDIETDKCLPKKVKKDKGVDKIIDFLKEKETNTDRRHKEDMAKKDRALNMCDKLLSLAEKLLQKWIWLFDDDIVTNKKKKVVPLLSLHFVNFYGLAY